MIIPERLHMACHTEPTGTPVRLINDIFGILRLSVISTSEFNRSELLKGQDCGESWSVSTGLLVTNGTLCGTTYGSNLCELLIVTMGFTYNPTLQHGPPVSTHVSTLVYAHFDLRCHLQLIPPFPGGG